jgi:hypothetical protein
MVLIRAYAVLTKVVVEVTCWHGLDGSGSHMLLREERDVAGMEFHQVLAEIAKVVELASWYAAQELEQDGPLCEQLL